MKIEIRLDNIKKLKSLSTLQFDVISIGNEGCVFKIPSKDDVKEIKKFAHDEDIEIKYVTPIASQKYQNYIVKNIKEVFNSLEEAKLTINDYGILNCLNEDDNNFEIYLGNGLCWSNLYCSWYLDQIGSKNGSQSKDFSIINFDNGILLNFIKKKFHKVVGVELSLIEDIFASLQNITEIGFAIHGVLDLVPLSYSRSCFFAKYFNFSVENCNIACSDETIVRMTHNFELNKNQYVELDNEIKDQLCDLYIYENVIFRRNENVLLNKEFNYLPIENVIVDTRFYNWEQLSCLIEKLNDSETRSI